MSAKGLSKRIGQAAVLHAEGFAFAVAVLDARANYGRTDYKVTPCAGAGERWVSESRLTFTKEGAPSNG